ncbi:glycosyltransferase family 2 protein [Desulforhabdus sp. TSK]|uniref:glycosyltransferase family 2 protein n=1 Tax=Desulforhabdus sp. TSK TaxID=2925014 RepID=UPI001FC835DF|nr:glycosyltransferase family 2 protein [Desulforhabdus sp. TSK]GKT08223.1 hypothetical protein DSTSK_15280 [Desulforhabdus sp. TSK]
MKLTVIIPAYNSEDTIEECIKAIIYQKRVKLNSDYSVLLVDDGSTDKTIDIAQKYPIEILSLQENHGRIIARLTGALHTKTEKILFVDSRVILNENLISLLEKYCAYPAVMGEQENDPNIKYENFFSTFLYLMRKKYYGKENFPLKIEQLIINKENFRKAPKGTTILFIDRELFISLTPERTGKHVNNDTLLFQKLIFEKGIDLIKIRELFFQYKMRSELKKFRPWLYDRGMAFSDFYLVQGGYFHKAFLTSTIFILFLIMTLTISAFMIPKIFIFISILLLIAYLIVIIYLSENIKDVMILFFSTPVIIFIFGAGIVSYHIKLLKNTL